ncbi:MAG TPA: HAD family hydrolase [Candidatus Kryptonia bacterium]
MKKKYSLVIFDIDGTLADTSRLIFDSFNHVAKKYRSKVFTPQEIMSYFGPPEEVALKNIIGEENFDSVWRDYLDYYREHSDDSTIFPGIKKLLTELKSSGCRLAVFTGKGSHTTEITLSYHGLRDLFDVIVTGSMLKNHKPDPEGVEFALKALGIAAGDAVLVGDSRSDFKAAAAARIHFIAAVYDSLAANRFDNIDCAKVTTVDQLSSLLLSERNGNE